MGKIKTFFSWLRSCISPVYVAMLVAAFVLWFIAKLGGTYTTDIVVSVSIDDVEYSVPCSIKGKGTNLIYYTLSPKRTNVKIPASDLSFETVVVEPGHTVVHITSESLEHALKPRMNDLSDVSVNTHLTVQETIVDQTENSNIE